MEILEPSCIRHVLYCLVLKRLLTGIPELKYLQQSLKPVLHLWIQSSTDSKRLSGQGWWHTLSIKALRRQRQAGMVSLSSRPALVYIMRPCLKKPTKQNTFGGKKSCICSEFVQFFSCHYRSNFIQLSM